MDTDKTTQPGNPATAAIDLDAARQLSQEVVDEAVGEAAEISVAICLQRLLEFCRTNRQHINLDNLTTVAVDYGPIGAVQIGSNRHATRAVVFALDTLTNPTVVIRRINDDRHVVVRGEFKSLPMKVVTIAHGQDATRIDRHIDWDAEANKYGGARLTADALRELAAEAATS